MKSPHLFSQFKRICSKIFVDFCCFKKKSKKKILSVREKFAEPRESANYAIVPRAIKGLFNIVSVISVLRAFSFFAKLGN